MQGILASGCCSADKALVLGWPRDKRVGFVVVVFELYRLALRVLVSWAALHFVATTIGFLRRRPEPTPPEPNPWPRVTVQLPMRNEYFTACRVLEAAAALDYPHDRLQIQVLDDSDDGTSELLAELIVGLKNRGLDVVHLRRELPVHYKAGALQAGLASATGELVAMFDADFVPPADFLRRVVPHFEDPSVALAQGAWSFINREASWLTRMQAQIFDALFLVEQTAKSRARLPFQFNGTAGVWRREAIDRAGGWTFDSLTEDLDLSIRVQMLGYRMVNLPDVRVPSELPTTLAAFRVQQRRWALGTAQLLRKRTLSVLRAELPLRSRMAIVTQLGRHLIHPFVMLMVLSVPITTLYWVDTPIMYGWTNAAVLAVLAASVSAQHAVGARMAGQSVLRALVYAPLVIPLAIALVPTYCVALVYGLRDRAGEFFRTPKLTRAPREQEPDYRPRRSWLVLAEIGLGLAYVHFTAEALRRGFLQNGAFLAMLAFSFLVMGLGSLRTRARFVERREQTAPASAPAPAPAPAAAPAPASVGSLAMAASARRES
jgi:cellulose synthase/poly-beta-1,6-N-acetylglucosamine synthase-like glycosyltransferase